MLTAAATLPRTRPWVRRVAPHLPVAVLVAGYALYFGQLSVAVHDGYGTPGYDMGIFDQGVWLLSRFHAPFVTVMGRNLFGDHTSFVLLLAVPLYWLWPRAQTLLVLQACLIAAAAIPIYLLARKRTGSGVMATALAAAFLLNPALQNGNLEQFHPEAFLVLFVALAIYAAIEWKPALLAVSVALCLLVKEDTALLIIPLGAWVYWRRNRTWGLAIMAGAIAWMVFAYEVVIAALLGTTSFYANRIPFGGLGGAGHHSVRPPAQVLGLRAQRVPAVLSLADGSVLRVGLFDRTRNSRHRHPDLRRELPQHLSLHATDPVPLLAASRARPRAGHGVRGRLAGLPRRRVAATCLVTAAAVVSCTLWGLAPFSRNVYPHQSPTSPQVRAINTVLRDVPPSAVVSAYYPYVAHLDHRVRIYQWPTPFRATYWGLYNEEGQRLPFSGDVQYLVLPTVLTGVDQSVFNSIANQFQVVGEGGGVGGLPEDLRTASLKT